MIERQFVNTSSHMVQEVLNIIDDYKMGSLRALAQEPVQNALDAKRQGQARVEVEYRLLRRTLPTGDRCYLLTVTDRGTTGLRGEMVAADELAEQNYRLKPEENWAAFEAQVRDGFAKAKVKGNRNFAVIPNALQKRFPASGPGSALLPQHYPEDELREIVSAVLDAARDAHFGSPG